MVDFIELGGAKRPVRFGLNTLRVFSKEFDISIGDLGNIMAMSFDKIFELIYAGLIEGAKKENQQIQYTIEHLCDWLEEDTGKVQEDEDGKTVKVTKLDEMLGIFADQFGGGEAEGNQEAPVTG